LQLNEKQLISRFDTSTADAEQYVSFCSCSVYCLTVFTMQCTHVFCFVCLVCNAGLWSHRLEILETNCTHSLPNTFALRSQKAIHQFPGEHGETLGRLKVLQRRRSCWARL